MSKVAIIGNGNVGFHLAKEVTKNHETFHYTRQVEEKQHLPIEEFNPDRFDFSILCLPDDQIKQFSDSIPKSSSFILHTSGSRPLEDLDKHDCFGVLYPFQTFSKEREIIFDNLPLLIETKSKRLGDLTTLAKSISSNVKEVNSKDRLMIHLAAVFACNFSNHLFNISDQLLSKVGLEFKDLSHLVNETVSKSLNASPKKAQTGPAIRGDVETMKKHLELLEKDEWKQIYELVSQDIRNSR